MATTQLAGSCLCGQVAYEVEVSIKRFYYCHCQQCRKLTGSAHAANILAEPTTVNWLKGEALIKRFDAPDGRSFTHVFCKKCGSGLPFHNVSKSTLFIPAGSLDGEAEINVSRNIFWGEVPSWYEEGLSAKRCAKFPD